MEMIKIGIIEQDIDLCKTYMLHLGKSASFEIIFDFNSLEECATKGKQTNNQIPDIILIGDVIFELKALKALSVLLTEYSRSKIIVISTKTCIENILKVFNAGVHGYVSNTLQLAFLNGAIDDTLAYGTAISPDAAALILQHSTSRVNNNFYTSLTAREMEIALSIVDGKSYKELALHLFVSVYTINHHLKNIYRKLEVKSKSELISVLLNNRVIP